MAAQSITFRYLTGIKTDLFRNARLRGSWDSQGRHSANWSETPMTAQRGEDGCPSFETQVSLDTAEAGKVFEWGVVLDGPRGANQWAIPAEEQDPLSTRRVRQFRFDPTNPAGRVQEYYLTYTRRLGARKHFKAQATKPDLRFAVWAPNAAKVEVVFGQSARGYIDDNGVGIDPARPPIPLHKGGGGIWQSDPVADFAQHEGLPYMYRITTGSGATKYRTDIFSRKQAGSGAINPKDTVWDGRPASLDGTKSCSVVASLDTVTKDFDPVPGQEVRISAEDFWATEFTPGVIIPSRMEDLIIYELHVGSLGFGRQGPGNLKDALELIDKHLAPLGVNAVELLPLSEFSGEWGWGYGDSHHFVIESSAGGRDQFKHFVRACHRRGIAVILDVCYNHYDLDAERAQWQYDSEVPEENIYFWYEGQSANYSDPFHGYLNNGSSGFSPRYSEEVVRQQFISSAAAFIDEFHIDGLRVDLTQAFHRDNSQNIPHGFAIAAANQYGTKLLREWTRTLRFIKPSVLLFAEDHSGWEKVTQSTDIGGLGFAATWFADFYHHLIGDSKMSGGKARLLREAGFGHNGPLDVTQFSGVLYDSKYNRVVYHESHDEAANAEHTGRTIGVAVNSQPLIGATRDYAEARTRAIVGLSLLSAGTPMFFMGEEIGAQKPFTVMGFPQNREDLHGERTGLGADLFRFYQDLIQLRRRRPALRSQEIDIIHVRNDTRVIAFTRIAGNERLLVLVSLNNTPYLNGYVIQTDSWRLPAGGWREVFNSDAAAYGGQSIGNFGASLPVTNGRIDARTPANGFLVFVKE